jgi:hypothetical protein
MGVPDTSKMVRERLALLGRQPCRWAELYDPNGDQFSVESSNYHILDGMTDIDKSAR